MRSPKRGTCYAWCENTTAHPYRTGPDAPNSDRGQRLEPASGYPAGARTEGFEIEEASDGQDGLRKFLTRPAELVLCDVFIPEQDGLDFLRELQREFVVVKVVTMSGGGEFHGPVNLLPLATFLGAVAVLHKPFEQADLLKVVRQVLHPLPI